MPQLDVSFMTTDPMLADSFDVTRNREVMVNGRATVDPEPFFNVVGVVTQQDPAELMRREDGQFVPRRIFVATMFALQGAVLGYQPDIIHWNGSDYHVVEVFPYSRFGQGVYEVVASTQKATDVPQ